MHVERRDDRRRKRRGADVGHGVAKQIRPLYRRIKVPPLRSPLAKFGTCTSPMLVMSPVAWANFPVPPVICTGYVTIANNGCGAPCTCEIGRASCRERV